MSEQGVPAERGDRAHLPRHEQSMDELLDHAWRGAHIGLFRDLGAVPATVETERVVVALPGPQHLFEHETLRWLEFRDTEAQVQREARPAKDVFPFGSEAEVPRRSGHESGLNPGWVEQWQSTGIGEEGECVLDTR